LGVVGARAARELVESAEVGDVLVSSRRHARADHLAGVLGAKARVAPGSPDADVVVIASEAGTHLGVARRAVEEGRSVVSTSDDPHEVASLLELDAPARAAGVSVVVGAAFSPGLSCLLARHAAELVDEVEEIQVAMTGAAGPVCAHHRAELADRDGREIRDGSWATTDAGSERELLWFPDPIGARDCARGELVEPLLLHRLFPEASRLGARTGIERVARWQGLLRRGLLWRAPVAPVEGPPGALRVEVRGQRDGAPTSVVYAAMDRASLGAGVTAAVVALGVAGGAAPTGAGGVAELLEPLPVLAELARRGIRAATFEPS
jgi:saccharopine dehydrogenase-like NADP-dependent oxidoreductase